MLLPIGLDESRLARLPWVSIGILIANVVVFLLMALGPGDERVEAKFEEVASDPARALDLAQRAAGIEAIPPELRDRARSVAEQLLASGAAPARPAAESRRPEAIALGEHPPAVEDEDAAWPIAPALLAAGEAVRVVYCQLLGVSPGGLDLVTGAGRRALVPGDRIAAVAAGVVGELDLGGDRRRNAVLLDVLLHPHPADGARVVLRAPGHQVALGAIAPGLSAREAWGRLVEGLLAASAAIPMPSTDAVAGRPFARFADPAAFEAAAWGRQLESPA